MSHPIAPFAAQVSHDGRFLAQIAVHGVTMDRVWDACEEFSFFGGMKLAPGHRLLLTVWDIDRVECIGEADLSDGGPLWASIEWSNVDRYIVTSSSAMMSAARVRVWSRNEQTTGISDVTPPLDPKLPSGVSASFVAGDAKLLFVAGPHVRIVDSQSGEMLWQIARGFGMANAISPDGHCVAVGYRFTPIVTYRVPDRIRASVEN